MLIGSVSAALRGSTDKIILASMASPVWAGQLLGIAARLANLVMEASNVFYAPLIAVVRAPFMRIGLVDQTAVFKDDDDGTIGCWCSRGDRGWLIR